MRAMPRILKLDYLREYHLGNHPGTQRRNVPLELGSVRNIELRAHQFDFSTFCWRQARKLEGREDADDGEGIWPISCWRCEKRFGMPGVDLFPRGSQLSDATPEVYAEARQMRRLCYFRVASSEEAISLINAGQVVRYATELTEDWYDPDNGIISVTSDAPTILGSHAVPVSGFDSKSRRLTFTNSWGEEWGAEGHGAISVDHFDRFLVEAWFSPGAGGLAPTTSKSGIVCLEWKWSLNDAIGVHGREIVDATTSERLAWAFAKPRDGFLDVEEFFVWPSERGKGYGRALSKMVKELASTMNLPVRLLVSYADTEPENVSSLDMTVRLFDVAIEETSERWVHKIGTSATAQVAESRPRPKRPANMLEWLRPKDEQPIDTPLTYCVYFGTNRRPVVVANGEYGFGAERDTRLHVGKATVTIPQTHKFGTRGRSWWRFWKWLTNSNAAILERQLFTDEAEFSEALRRHLPAFKKEGHNLLFVHGYRVSFDEAISEAAQLGVDLKIPGATFVYSWPSAGKLGAYSSDEASVEAAAPHFEEYIRRLLRDTMDMPLNIIVHSMGNRAVLKMLESLFRESPALQNHIGNVIFAAPDVDTDVFKTAIAKLSGVARRLTLYATRGDLPLLASEWFHNYNRAGLAPPVVTNPGMDTVIVENFDLWDLLAHGYYSAARPVLHDMFNLLHYNTNPVNRPGLVQALTTEGAPYWKLGM